MKTVRVVLLALLLPWLEIWPRAAEAVLPLRTNDVIAFIGGANMVALAQSGHLETLLTLRHPHHRLRFRSLAWEGDTVFAQPRDVNYPDLVTQLKQVGATVAFVQFGQMESLAGEAGLTNFVTAYEQLVGRLSADSRRVSLVDLDPIALPLSLDRSVWITYRKSVIGIADRLKLPFCDLTPLVPMCLGEGGSNWQRNGISVPDHLMEATASVVAGQVSPKGSAEFWPDLKALEVIAVHRSVAEKNRLWFNYARPSNWAFLAGDRTEQAFSRDYRDRNIRAFAQEMQQFLPLIAEAEKRIDELAAKAAEKESAR
jgi:hypothetical protein